MQAIFLEAKEYSVPKTKVYEDLDEIMLDLGLTKSEGAFPTFETMLLNEDDPQFEGIGIIAHDQDRRNMKMNILGIKGDFVIVGMKRLEPGTPSNPHMFEGLDDDQVRLVRRNLAIMLLHANR